jgi:hypothetical protein
MRIDAGTVCETKSSSDEHPRLASIAATSCSPEPKCLDSKTSRGEKGTTALRLVGMKSTFAAEAGTERDVVVFDMGGGIRGTRRGPSTECCTPITRESHRSTSTVA